MNASPKMSTQYGKRNQKEPLCQEKGSWVIFISKKI